MLLIAALLGFLAERQRRIANENLSAANRNLSAALAERALRVGGDNYDLGLLLTAEAFGYADSFEARNAFMTLLQLNPTVTRFFPGSTRILVNPDKGSFIVQESVWDIRTGHSTPLPSFQSWFLPLAFRPDGRVAAFCGGTDDDKEIIRVLDLNGGRDLAQFALGEFECLSAKGAFSANGEQILVAVKGQLHTWNLETRQANTTPLEKWAGEEIVFDSQALVAAGGNEGGRVTVWDVRSGKVVNSATEHDVSVTSLVFSNDSKLLASGDQSGTVIVWSLMPLKANIRSLRHYQSVQSLAFTPDGVQLAAGGPTTFGGFTNFGTSVHRISIWNLNTGEPSSSLLELRSPIWSLHFIDGGRRLIAGGVTETRLLEVSQNVLSQSTQQNTGLSVSQPKIVALSEQISASINKDVLTVKNRRDEHAPLEYRIPEEVVPVSLTARDDMVAVGGKNGSLFLTDPARRTLRFIGQHPSEVAVVCFSPDGRLLAASGKQGSVSLWDVQHAKNLWLQNLPGDVRAIAVSPDGTVAAGGWGSDSTKGFLFILSAGDNRRGNRKN